MDRLGLCGSCNAVAARYKCPRCALATCSLQCSTSHKAAQNCSGVAKPVHEQAIPANEWSWGALMRDQSYISSLSRLSEEKGKLLAEKKLIPTGRGAADGEGRLDDRNDKEDALVREARREGVELVLLSKGMSKRQRNSSRWDLKGNKIDWSVDVVFHPASSLDASSIPAEPEILTLASQASTTPLHQVLVAAFESRDRKGKGKQVDDSEAEWRQFQRSWLDSHAPPTTASDDPSTSSLSSELPSTKSEETLVTPPRPPTDSSFTLLLRVTPLSPRHVSEPNSEDPSSPSAPIASRSSSKQYYSTSFSETLRQTISHTVVLEYPTLEVWPSEVFSLLKKSGKMEIISKPERVALPDPMTSTWTRGRGRGRGRGESTRGNGRGGRGGERSVGGGGGRDEFAQLERRQDSGWGKRAAPSSDHGDVDDLREVMDAEIESTSPASKKVKLEDDVMVEKGGQKLPQEGMGLVGLVNYDSEEDNWSHGRAECMLCGLTGPSSPSASHLASVVLAARSIRSKHTGQQSLLFFLLLHIHTTMPTITSYTIEDLRFPTLDSSGTDAMNKECDYSAAYVTLFTDSPLKGFGMTFTIGRGNDIVCAAVHKVAQKLIGKTTEELFGNMGAAWDYLLSDSQLRWIGPEKGVIHIATGAVVNALWDLYARHERKPLWKLICDFTPEEFVKAVSFRYITDAITPDEALAWLKSKQAGKEERLKRVLKEGYPSYTTAVGWFGYPDEKVARLTREAIAQGFNHFKVKVGGSVEDDRRRLKLVRSIIDDPKECAGRKVPEPQTLVGKNAGPTGSVLMIDFNQVCEVQQAVDYTAQLAEFGLWFVEEPTAPDDILGHANIRKQLKQYGVGVATGEHGHNRMLFKQLLQAEAVDVVQIDSCRLAGVNEILAVLLMSAKFGKPVCPHAGGVGLCEYVIHLSLIDYICVSGNLDVNVLEYVDNFHDHFETPCSINALGHYNCPLNPDEGYSIEIKDASKAQFIFPNGSYWSDPEKRKAHNMVD